MRVFIFVVMSLMFTVTTAAQGDPSLTFAYTYHQPTGNRIVEGQGTFPNVITQTLDIGSPFHWLASASIGFDQPNVSPLWVSVSEDGLIHYFGLDNAQQLIEAASYNTDLPSTKPLSLSMSDTGQPWILNFDESPLSHPVTTLYGWVYVNSDGGVDLRGLDVDATPLPLNALPDARIVVNDTGQIAVYTAATDQRYVHGVLGDALEAAALTVLEIDDNELTVIAQVNLPDNDVFEGISPFWADIDEDGVDDLVVTVSNGTVGAQVRAYHADGALLATGPAIGLGGRWRHQLAFGPFGPNGEQELVDVLTPHIGGVVEFYQLNGTQLEIVASLPGYTSHVIGSRNLDMAVAGDFNGDGQPEIVLPTQDRTVLAGLQRTADGVQEVWRLPLDGVLSTNLSAVTLPDNTLALAAGTVDGRLRVWLSSE